MGKETSVDMKVNLNLVAFSSNAHTYTHTHSLSLCLSLCVCPSFSYFILFCCCFGLFQQLGLATAPVLFASEEFPELVPMMMVRTWVNGVCVCVCLFVWEYPYDYSSKLNCFRIFGTIGLVSSSFSYLFWKYNHDSRMLCEWSVSVG